MSSPEAFLVREQLHATCRTLPLRVYAAPFLSLVLSYIFLNSNGDMLSFLRKVLIQCDKNYLGDKRGF